MSTTALVSACASAVCSAICMSLSSSNSSRAQIISHIPHSTISQVEHYLHSLPHDQSHTTGVYVEITAAETYCIDTPLIAEMSGQTAIIVEHIVERVIEDLIPTSSIPTDPSQPSMLFNRFSWIQRNEIVSHDCKQLPSMHIRDASTSTLIRVYPDDLNLSSLMIETVNHFRPLNSIEQIPFPLPYFRSSSPFIPDERTRCIGHRYIERIIPVPIHVYCLGEVILNQSNELILHQPSGKHFLRPFEFSFKDEYEIKKIAETKSGNLQIAAVISGAISVSSLLYHFIKKYEQTRQKARIRR